VSNLVPLPEIISEIAASGPATKTVEQAYNRVIASLGAELDVLQCVPVEDIGRTGSSLLAEAIARLRAGQVIREAGYDGEYGVIRLFEEGELARRGGLLFDAPVAKRGKVTLDARATPLASPPPERGMSVPKAPGGGLMLELRESDNPRSTASRSTPVTEYAARASRILAALDDEQRAAAEIVDGPLLIAAGPGSGKTRMLTHRIAHLVAERDVPATSCLAIAFTRRAAAEMRQRLAQLAPDGSQHVAIHTFHSLGLTILREHPDAAGLRPGFRIAGEAERVRALAETMAITEVRAQQVLRAISKAKRTQGAAPADMAAPLAAYAQALAVRDWIDFDDVIARALPLCLGRRVPGRRRGAVSVTHHAGAAARQSVRDRRPQPGDLRLPRRGFIVLRPVQARLPARRRQPAAQLSLDRHDRRGLVADHRRRAGRADRDHRARHA
jgi:DNA helicase II / ATP-dependent DNA helicase PcrA